MRFKTLRKSAFYTITVSRNLFFSKIPQNAWHIKGTSQSQNRSLIVHCNFPQNGEVINNSQAIYNDQIRQLYSKGHFFYSEKHIRRKLSLLGIKSTNRRLLEWWSFLTIFQDQETIRVFSLISSPKSKTLKILVLLQTFLKDKQKIF